LFFPFDILLGPLAGWINVLTIPCCWCVYLPIWWNYALPWNYFWYSLFLAPIWLAFAIFLGPALFLIFMTAMALSILTALCLGTVNPVG